MDMDRIKELARQISIGMIDDMSRNELEVLEEVIWEKISALGTGKKRGRPVKVEEVE